MHNDASREGCERNTYARKRNMRTHRASARACLRACFLFAQPTGSAVLAALGLRMRARALRHVVAHSTQSSSSFSCVCIYVHGGFGTAVAHLHFFRRHALLASAFIITRRRATGEGACCVMSSIYIRLRRHSHTIVVVVGVVVVVVCVHMRMSYAHSIQTESRALWLGLAILCKRSFVQVCACVCVCVASRVCSMQASASTISSV